jgi:hypothetical protein
MKTAAPEKKPANPFEDLMASFLQAPPAAKPAQPEPPPSAPFNEMMEKGREMQMQYLTSLQSIFTDAWKGSSNKS